MSARTASQVAVITAAAALTGLVGYAFYFDYQRRNNPDFRKGLKKQQKKLAAAAEARTKAEKERNSKALREALATVQAEIPPTSPEEQEAYFQEQVAEGEKLSVQGPEFMVPAATHFYRALRVYPQPVELLMIYQKVVPAPIFALLLELTSLTGGGMGGAPPPGASLADIDEGEITGSPNGATSATSGSGSGMGSGGEWERLSDEERR
ncbi:mitochondrial outer membrane translocase complex, subunit Tom20 domain-containing protein [Naematelia encephala]|uniref:Mitochondrial outer membrane translocase complex, subunit Tom20 domain-containing protein n=1 Tax=Naematelia encephala TaxID=71784 RepID=A0A1Y2BC69_9TREE|nr:mitochondrial outer membrane translocase complex, subunit Tom20 domain-containing protein [Naematelia encephala]